MRNLSQRRKDAKGAKKEIKKENIILNLGELCAFASLREGIGNRGAHEEE